MSFELKEVKQLPEYECHKRVRAAKITGVCPADAEGTELILDGDQRVRVTSSWHQKHMPDIGGYYVQYADGYASYSPAKTFEEGYTLVPN